MREGSTRLNTPHNKSRLTERRAVNASQAFFEDHDLIFQEIDLRNDIGKDAILDLARSGKDAGLAIALQIKGGRKYKRNSGHSIPIDQRLRNIWRNSSIPMFAIIHDPDNGELYWGNLTEMARNAPENAGTVSVSPDTRLTPDGLGQFLEAARLECSARRSDPLLNLTSTDPDLLQSALVDCLVLGRRDPRYLTLVRSLLSFMGDQKSFFMAVELLAHATPHPDIFWHKGNYIEDEIASVICKSFKWTPNEIAMLLARLPEEGGWSRGTIGQSLCMVLLEDPALDWSIDRLLTEAFRQQDLTWRSCWVKAEPFGPKWVRTDRDAIILPSLTLSLHLATDPRARLAEIVERLPPIEGVEMFEGIAEEVALFGWIEIF
jgi:hypothetical protein